jgi:WD repeat-containing protein 48
VDYFSASTAAANDQSEASSESDKVPKTPGIGTENNSGTVSTPTSPTEEKKKGLFGKKFGMGMSLTKKMTTRSSVEVKAPVASAEEKLSDTASMRSSDKDTEKPHNIEDNFFGVVQKIRLEYDEHLEHRPGQPLPPGITPSPPSETPVLAPPPHTTIIIQEDNPESGGLADQYRGEISELGNPSEVDVLEKIAPMWLGDLLLRVSSLSSTNTNSPSRAIVVRMLTRTLTF